VGKKQITDQWDNCGGWRNLSIEQYPQAFIQNIQKFTLSIGKNLLTIK
jgi:hypothetical protein